MDAICDVEIRQIVKDFTIDKYQRNASFDYCYNYFTNVRGKDLVIDMEKSCLVLGFYLASWGMLRGSTFLFHKSVKHYENLIDFFASKCEDSDWEIDVHNYNEKKYERICTINDAIKERLGGKIKDKDKIPSVILATKVMLGVFGFIPAYDENFVKAFKQIKFSKGKCSFTIMNKESLDCLKEFYEANKEFINERSKATFTIDFSTGEPTKIHYTKAKIIDMYGFTKGEKL